MVYDKKEISDRYSTRFYLISKLKVQRAHDGDGAAGIRSVISVVATLTGPAGSVLRVAL